MPTGAAGPVLSAVGIAANGLATGIMLATVIGVAPYQGVQSYREYVAGVRFMWPRFDPIMPALNLTALLVYLVLAILVADSAPVRIGFGLAAALLAGTVLISVTKNLPVNRYVASLDPDHPPADWSDRDPRGHWRRWNVVRTGSASTAFVIAVLTTAFAG
ncbi:DUF1772 domain-containing protein [Nocardia brasiliensis]|uniref:DUF1772 domain-containing protein n=1 Tax=Nocardia brasiliensis TaxID=37326 RepID=UPI00366CBF67